MILIDKWSKLKEYVYPIRHEVFVVEQFVPVELELDEFDPEAWHALCLLKNLPVGTGRLVREFRGVEEWGRIGRMAVLEAYRGQYLGLSILDALIDKASDMGIIHLYLHAQVSAVSFYEKRGFKICGDVFDEAGIPHQEMELNLG